MPATLTRPSLRTALLLDATASGAMGALLAAAAPALAPPFALPVALLRGSGIALIPFAALLVWLARRADAAVTGPTRLLAWAVVAGNALWVIDSVALLASAWVAPSALGEAFVLAQAVAVAAFTWLEASALRALPSGAAWAARA